jgi:lysophospholipase L1-like esterase
VAHRAHCDTAQAWGLRCGREEVHGDPVEGLLNCQRGQVLGRGVPEWDGGEPVNQHYPDGPIRRSNGFVPGPHDFAYVSMGTNDASNGIQAARTVENLEWMADTWIGAGLPPSHFMLTTLPPTVPPFGEEFPAINEAIRRLAVEKGIHIIDLAAHTSDDDGVSWRSEELHVGDRLHYSEAVRDWLAAQVVNHMSARVPGRARSVVIGIRG